MKRTNVKFTAIATYSDGATSNLMAFVTESAMRKWVNKQYMKDEGVVVTVWEGYSMKVYRRYSA